MAIFYTPWEAYPWKNQLATQEERVRIHFAELISDEFEGSHNPLHMLDHALVLAAFAIRRMFEKRLVTDKLGVTEIPVRLFKARQTPGFRTPYISHSGGYAHNNYDLETAEIKNLKIKSIADEIIHSSQIMVVDQYEVIPAGLLIASDWHLKNRILHFTIEEFNALVKSVLDDQVKQQSDCWDPEAGTVKATRV